MHPMRRIEEIKSTLEEDEAGAAEIRAAARLVESETSAGAVLAAVASDDFPATLIRRSQRSPQARAWLTLAAAGAQRARQVLAWRASQVLEPVEAIETLAGKRSGHQGERLGVAGGPEADGEGARLLLSRLSGRELRRLIRGRPALATARRRARAESPRQVRPTSSEGRESRSRRSARPLASS